MRAKSVRVKEPFHCWVLEVAGCDERICRQCSELEKARIAATWTLLHRAKLASGALVPGKRK
ncbi:MAG: hypothetical protein ACM3X5_03200 [Bacillota bacterium]